jgi:thiosulfate reductase cytochrome b subunit
MRHWLRGLRAAGLALLVLPAQAALEHPDFPALDADGQPLALWDDRVSEQRSCGECHDSAYIEATLSTAHRLRPDALSSTAVARSRAGVEPLADSGDVSCMTCHGSAEAPALVEGLVSGAAIMPARSVAGCSACHGDIVLDSEPPYLHDGVRQAADMAFASGALNVAQRASSSGMNIADKAGHTDPFDLHLARGMTCIDCHRGSTRPGDRLPATDAPLQHLRSDPRSVSISEHLRQPDHGMGATRVCTDCHRANAGHRWLPFRAQHVARLACESCHIPRPLGPALRSEHLDSGDFAVRGRGESGLIEGFVPLLVARDGRLAPVNLIATTFTDSADTRTQVAATGLHHGVQAATALRECSACHWPGARPQGSLPLGALPADASLQLHGSAADFGAALHLERAGGSLVARANPDAAGIYVLGADQVSWADRLGMLIASLTLLGVLAHGGARYLAARRRGEERLPRERVYMYGVYERLWHWLQATAILILLVTGAAIHKPYLFGFLSFPYMVHLHNVVGFILLANAFLAAFYHYASGEIRQYLPGRDDLFGRMFLQARYYVGGIFRGDPHPFAKDADHKLNPLQQLTYFGLLNTLLPAQMLTGIAIWGAQRWPELSSALGGLYFLAPLHSFMAWLFAAFLIMHIYLTTTAGPKPLSGIKAMLEGWEDVEAHSGGNT